MTVDAEGASTVDPDRVRDLSEDDRLLGVPLRDLLNARALRGLGYLVLALVLLAWHGRSMHLVGVIAGLAVGTYAVSTAYDVIRMPERKQFVHILSIGISGGFAVALVLHPVNASDSFVQAIGGVALAGAGYDLLIGIRRRSFTAWAVAKIVALVLVGALLIQFDRNVLTVATVLLACALLVTGIYQMFSVAPEVDYETKDGVAIERVGHRLAQQITHRLQRQPDMAETRESLQAKVFFEGEEAPVRFGRFAVLMAFASVIASIGVVAQSTAVVIGAMLIAPLMTPLLGMALSATMGWLRRFRRAAFVSLAGIVIAIGTGVIVGAVSPHHVDVTTNAQVLSRITPTILDLAIAVAAGAAGAFALSRRDVSDSLPGVAVAIALVPPLTVIGLCWQQGEWAAGNGALLLFLTNVTAILLAGGATFVLVGAAPLERVSAAQERVATLAGGLVLDGGGGADPAPAQRCAPGQRRAHQSAHRPGPLGLVESAPRLPRARPADAQRRHHRGRPHRTFATSRPHAARGPAPSRARRRRQAAAHVVSAPAAHRHRRQVAPGTPTWTGGALGRIRTGDLPLRRRLLYPPELPGRGRRLGGGLDHPCAPAPAEETMVGAAPRPGADHCALGRIRTGDLPLRRRLLYPPELPGRGRRLGGGLDHPCAPAPAEETMVGRRLGPALGHCTVT